MEIIIEIQDTKLYKDIKANRKSFWRTKPEDDFKKNDIIEFQDTSNDDSCFKKVSYIEDDIIAFKTIKKESTFANMKLSDVEIINSNNKEDNYIFIAESFRQLFIHNLNEKNAPTTHQDNALVKNYVPPIKLMIEKDKVTKEQLRLVYNFLKSEQGEFWKPNILSTKKLREKFTVLLLKASQNGNRNKHHSNSDSQLKQQTNRAVNHLFGKQQSN